MKSNYLRIMDKPRVSRRAMANYMTRAAVDGRVQELIKKHEGERIDELSAFAGAVDANWLWTLHNELHFARRGCAALGRRWCATGSRSASSTATGTAATLNSPPGRTLRMRSQLRSCSGSVSISRRGSARISSLITRPGR